MTTPTPTPTTAPHDLRVRLVQSPGAVTDNCLGMLAGAARGYADGPCRGLVGRIVLEGLRETLDLRPRAFKFELDRVCAALLRDMAARGMQISVELVAGAEPAFLLTPLEF